jgi:hypothetical protein
MKLNDPTFVFESADKMRSYYRQVHGPYRLPNGVDNRLVYLNQNLSRAANRDNNWSINVDKFDLFMIGHTQGWVCAVTKIPLEFTRGGTEWNGKWCNPNSCTIDRIDPTLGYVHGNCQLVTWEFNCFKSSFSVERLQYLSQKVIDNMA